MLGRERVRPEWALREKADDGSEEGTIVVLSKNGARLATFEIEDCMRPGAAEAVRQLAGRGLPVEIVSGDRAPAVARLADELGIEHWQASLLPSGKLARIRELGEQDRRVLMVGDGLNDAPALAAAHVSMAPATAADIGRNAADFVFLHEHLSAVSTAFDIARKAGRLIRENFALAIVYNALAVPIAVAGWVTPLIAAIAMSLSSVLVVANAMRLRLPAAPRPRALAGRPARGRPAAVAAR